jgi:hypothetical protein
MRTRASHLSTLAHVTDLLKDHLSSEDTPKARLPALRQSPLGSMPGKRSKQGLLGLIEDYRQGLLPLIVPLTPFKHHLNRCPAPDCVPVPFRVHQEVYLHRYPKELMQRNHV